MHSKLLAEEVTHSTVGTGGGHKRPFGLPFRRSDSGLYEEFPGRTPEPPRASPNRQRSVASGRARYHADRRSTPDCCPFQTNVGEALLAASIRKGVGLFRGPAMALVSSGLWLCPPLHGDKTTTGEEHPAYFSQTSDDVRPVVHGGDRPDDRGGTLRQRDRLSGTFDVPHSRPPPGKESRDPQHHRRRINSGDSCSQSCRVADRGTGTTADVHHRVARPHAAQSYGKLRVAFATEDHAESGDEPRDSAKAWVVRVVIGRCVLFVHTLTLTVEPNFKSSGSVSEPLLTIGEVAERAGVATSTIRYYERLNLLVADSRMSGQRRYRVASLRRLVFIGMLQDAGLALVDIAGILNAANVSEWKAIATGRLRALDEEIATLVQARAYLSGALFCRYDHPATDCKIMGAEIDRRLSMGHGEE